MLLTNTLSPQTMFNWDELPKKKMIVRSRGRIKFPLQGVILSTRLNEIVVEL